MLKIMLNFELRTKCVKAHLLLARESSQTWGEKWIPDSLQWAWALI